MQVSSSFSGVWRRPVSASKALIGELAIVPFFLISFVVCTFGLTQVSTAVSVPVIALPS